MDQATEPVKPAEQAKRRFRGKVTPRVIIDDRGIKAAAVPEGSCFKGHEPFFGQDLAIAARPTRYLRARWATPAGPTILAPLPAGIEGRVAPAHRPSSRVRVYLGSLPPARR